MPHFLRIQINLKMNIADDYFEIKEVVEFAADIMAKTRRSLDYSIWSYMSHKRNNIGESFLDFEF